MLALLPNEFVLKEGRLKAADQGRPDAAQIIGSLRQLRGHPVGLVLDLKPWTQEIRFRTTQPHYGYVAGVLQRMYRGASVEAVALPAPAPGEPPTPGCRVTARMRLAQPLPFPIKTWDSFRPDDPVAALGGAVRQLEAGEQLESDLTLSDLPVTWKPPASNTPHLTPLVRMLNGISPLTLSLMGAFGYMFGLAALYGQLLWLRAFGILGLLALGAGLWLSYRNACWLYEPPGPSQADVKGRETLFAVTLTLTARAATPERAAQLLALWKDHYQVFDAGPDGNHWMAEAENGLMRWVDRLRPLYLTAAEIAGLWHLPIDALQSPFSARQGHRPLMPPPLLLDPLRLPQAPPRHAADGGLGPLAGLETQLHGGRPMAGHRGRPTRRMRDLFCGLRLR